MSHIDNSNLDSLNKEILNKSKFNERKLKNALGLSEGLSRRSLIKSGASFSLLGFLGPTVSEAGYKAPLIGFNAVPASTKDTVTLPPEYEYEILMSWGDPISTSAPAFDRAASEDDQALQFGDNTDGMELFFKRQTLKGKDSLSSVLAINNEYYNAKTLFTHGEAAKTKSDVLKAQKAVGITLVEVVSGPKQSWNIVRDSTLNSRLHMLSEFEVTGPAAGSDGMKTHADKSGRSVKGTLNNCGAGRTPWGTYLSCEENFNLFFGAPKATHLSESQKRYGLSHEGSGYNWWKFDSRFDISKEENEANRFGWVVEIDPFNPKAIPKKRTALGRFKHENAETVLSKEGRLVVYMGDDEKGEFLYKYVSNGTYPSAKDKLLDDGILYTARFNEDGSGEWLPLVFGELGLTPKHGFKDQADVLIRTREAASKVGATSMDRPEWVACHPSAALVFCTLTNNSNRGTDKGDAANGPNPRINNQYGQIVRWWPNDFDHASTGFQWDLYLMAGNPENQKGPLAGSKNITNDNMFNSPDGLKFDPYGRLWIQTDGNTSNEGLFEGHGNNQMLCGDPVTGELRRFLTGPIGCEVTGIVFSPDCTSLMVGIQHPTGAWPDAKRDGVPRSSLIVIRRKDGAVVGT